MLSRVPLSVACGRRIQRAGNGPLSSSAVEISSTAHLRTVLPLYSPGAVPRNALKKRSPFVSRNSTNLSGNRSNTLRNKGDPRSSRFFQPSQATFLLLRHRASSDPQGTRRVPSPRLRFLPWFLSVSSGPLLESAPPLRRTQEAPRVPSACPGFFTCGAPQPTARPLCWGPK